MLSKNVKVGLVTLASVAVVVIAVALVNFFRGNLRQATTSGERELSYSGMALESANLDMRAATTKGFAADSMAASQSPAPDRATDNDQSKTTERLIIKTGELSMVVKDVRATVQAVVQYAGKNGGFVVSSNIQENGQAPYATVVVRIPAKLFDAGVGEVKTLGEVKSESVNGQDVTEEYVDLDSRLKNLRATEEQLLAIMKRSGTIPDVLAVQRELMYVREQIEQIQGRMKYLRESADLSTLTVNLSTDPSMLPVLDDDEKWKPLATIKDAARDLLEVGKVVANVIIRLVVFIPLWLIIGLVVWVIVKIVRRRKNNNQTS